MKSNHNIFFLLILIILISSSLFLSQGSIKENLYFPNIGSNSAPIQLGVDYWPISGWKTSSPIDQGISSDKLLEMEQYIGEHNLGNYIDSLLIIRNGYLVYESYPSGHDADDRHHIYSCTKVFTSALVGIAIQEGHINGVHDHVLNFFPNKTIENLDTRKQSMTIQHLLTMTSGLEWTDQTNFYQMYATSDWVQYILDQQMQNSPGAEWNYNTGCSHLLSAILNLTTPNGTRIFAMERIFNPLNITNISWENDPQGIPIGGTLLYLTPRDMAKFGFLYLNNGLWNGSQLIPSNWVTESRTKFTSIEFDQGHGSGYGYQWWIYNWANAYTARGSFEQYIVVIPDLNMVVVTTGNADFQFIRLLVDYILPSAGYIVFNPILVGLLVFGIGIATIFGVYVIFRLKRKRSIKKLKEYQL